MEQSDPILPPDTFVYDADAPWGALRGGQIACVNDEPVVSFVSRTMEGLDGPPVVHRLSDFGGRIRVNLLKKDLKGSPEDGLEPLRDLYRATIRILLNADRFRLSLDGLRDELAKEPVIEPTKVDDVLRMMAAMDVLLIEAQGGGFRVGFTRSLEDRYRRREYLSTFTSELLAKSRRIDLLVGHSGTVGSYREELLRGLLKRLLPRRYEATTGFIEGCPRQLDIIVWDVENYAPLFREQNFVVVPLASVRAVIEVKTTLTRNSLRAGLRILWDTFRDRPTVLPVFKGVFAFEAGLGSSVQVANAMRGFYRSTEKTGVPHQHGYYWAGINGVCVPEKYLVRERYRPGGTGGYPQPMLVGVANPIGGDAYSAMFLGVLLSHLEIASAAKVQNHATFRPGLRGLEEEDLGAIYVDWKPAPASAEHAAILDQAAARTYVDQVHDFRAGRIEGHLVGRVPPR